MSDRVTKDFCDERSRRILAEIKGEFEKLAGQFYSLEQKVEHGQKERIEISASMRTITAKMDGFAKKIVTIANNASNGKIKIEASNRWKATTTAALVMAASAIIVALINSVA